MLEKNIPQKLIKTEDSNLLIEFDKKYHKDIIEILDSLSESSE